MLYVRIVIFILLFIYLVMSFFFVHISLRYLRQLKTSEDKIYSLFVGQIALFKLLAEELNADISDEQEIALLLEERKLSELNKRLSEHEQTIRMILKENPTSSQTVTTILKGIEENVTLIRNEIYRHNKNVDNINVNAESIIFSIFVAILKLKKMPKI